MTKKFGVLQKATASCSWVKLVFDHVINAGEESVWMTRVLEVNRLSKLAVIQP